MRFGDGRDGLWSVRFDGIGGDGRGVERGGRGGNDSGDRDGRGWRGQQGGRKERKWVGGMVGKGKGKGNCAFGFSSLLGDSW
jgi:hypothetical protein